MNHPDDAPVLTLPLNVSVEARDIAAGRRRNCRQCPLVLATERAWAEATGLPALKKTVVTWDLLLLHLVGRVESLCFQLPGDVVAQIGRYDAGGLMSPLTFSLALPLDALADARASA